VLARKLDASADEIQSFFTSWFGSRISVIPLSEAEAVGGADIRLKHYRRSVRPLSYADCTLIATAKIYGATVVTSDHAVIDTARAEHVPVLALAS
jgi:rRNA-processing protein FCF1